MAGLDEDALHWVGVAVRESVINAIKHGNANDERKRVHVEFTPLARRHAAGHRDSRPRRRAGLRPDDAPRPAGAREPAQVERPRHLPDSQLHGRTGAAARARRRHGSRDGQARPARHSGEPVTPTVSGAGPGLFSPPPSRSSCAPAPSSWRRRRSGFRVDKKGTIDLVTEVDLECERMCRAVIAERFPDHDMLGRGVEQRPRRRRARRYRWVFDPLDGTTNYAHGLPIFCASLALEIDGRRRGRRRLRPDAAGAVHGRTWRGRLPERPAAARLDDGRRCSTRCS